MKEEVRMKVQELRQLLSTADRARLEKAFVESYKKFSNKRKTLRQIKIDTEEMIGQKLYDPIVYGGCEALKIHYTDEKPDVFHWV